MKATTSLLLASIVSSLSSPVLGAPPALVINEPAEGFLNQRPFLGITGDQFRGIASDWSSDAKKAILRGKNNLEKWYHDGREYIKQDNLLCTSWTFCRLLMLIISLDR